MSSTREVGGERQRLLLLCLELKRYALGAGIRIQARPLNHARSLSENSDRSEGKTG